MTIVKERANIFLMNVLSEKLGPRTSTRLLDYLEVRTEDCVKQHTRDLATKDDLKELEEKLLIEFRLSETGLCDEFKNTKTEQKTAITDLRTESSAAMAGLRAEIKTSVSELRTESVSTTAELRAEIKASTAELRTESATTTAELRAEIKASTAELRTEIKASETSNSR